MSKRILPYLHQLPCGVIWCEVLAWQLIQHLILGQHTQHLVQVGGGCSTRLGNLHHA
jgi:hypothetical protein